MRQIVEFRFSCILSVEVVDQFKGVFQEFHRFQGEFVIANPADKVFKILADKDGIQYFFHIKFNIGGEVGCFCPTSALLAGGSKRDTWNIGDHFMEASRFRL